MIKQLLYCIIICASPFLTAMAQKDASGIKFNLMFADKNLEVNKPYISKNQDTLHVSAFRFYISKIEIHYADSIVFKEQNSYHLVDIQDPKSTLVVLPIRSQKISKVTFTIGIDSTSSVSGALSGDLDATKGMYWAWQSGFINMKIEGTSTSCKTRKNEFQFHIGGYLRPNHAMRNIVLFPSNNSLVVNVDLSKIFEKIALSETNTIMIPGLKAMGIADLSCKMFSAE